jgi:hypothetical protein
MSLQTFKKKSVINYGSNRSGKNSSAKYWLPQGPFGSNSIILKTALENANIPPNGFSTKGTGIFRSSKENLFSKSGTPFRGLYPMGSGGCCGNYYNAEPVYPVHKTNTQGDRYLYIKPITLTNSLMLRKKYKWAYYGQYPNYWVQPVQDGTMQSDTKSQGNYIQNKSAQNMCVIDVNDQAKYTDHKVICGPTLCSTSTARFKYNDMASNAPYTKTIKQPLDSSQYTLYIQRQCQNPQGPQKPFPFAVQTGTGIKSAGTSITSVGNACNTSKYYLSPPEWYIKSNLGSETS